MHCIVIYEVQESAMMGGAGGVAFIEVMLFVAVQGGQCEPHGLECDMEGMVGAD